MKTSVLIYCQKSSPEARDAGGYDHSDLVESSPAWPSVKDAVRLAYSHYGICARHRGNTDPWFCSGYPVENREYFEHGIETYYSLHFPGLSPRALLRVDQMLAIAAHGKPLPL